MRAAGYIFQAAFSGLMGATETMHRLMRLVAARRIDLAPLLTHVFTLDEIERAYELFGGRRDKVLKVAIRVS